MKTAFFLFTVVGFGALTPTASFAGRPFGQGLDFAETSPDLAASHIQGTPVRVSKGKSEGKPIKSEDESQSSEMSGHTGLTKKMVLPRRPGVEPLKQGTNDHKVASGGPVDTAQGKLAALRDLHQPAVRRPSTIPARDGLLINKTGSRRENLIRLPVTAGAVVPSPGAVRSRNVTIAPLGQLTRASAKTSAAVISGTRANRKP